MLERCCVGCIGKDQGSICEQRKDGVLTICSGRKEQAHASSP